KPLDRRAQSVLRNTDPNLARGGLLDGVRFVEDHEVVWEKVTALPPELLFRAAEQHEEQRVVNDDHVGGEQSFAGLLKKAASALAAGFHGADVRLAANLRPNFL